MGTVVALSGQVGGAKLLDGLYRLRGKDLAAIVNTGDDYEHLTLRFSPDIDTVLTRTAPRATPTHSAAGSPRAATCVPSATRRTDARDRIASRSGGDRRENQTPSSTWRRSSSVSLGAVMLAVRRAAVRA